MKQRIAAIIGIGRYENALLNNNTEISKANTPTKNDEYLLVAQVFIFNDVLINTAVAGNHPKSPDPIFANPFPSTSLSLLNFWFVCFSASLPEIIVSNIVTIVTIDAILSIQKRMLGFVRTDTYADRGLFWINWNARFGYLSLNNIICGNNQCIEAAQIPIQSNDKIIAPGILGRYFLRRNNIPIPAPNVMTLTISDWPIFVRIVRKLI